MTEPPWMSAADVAGRECWCAVLPARTRVVQSRHLVRGPGATALGRSDLATRGSARLRNHMHGISLLPIAQPGCKLEDTSTEAAPTQRQLGVYDGDPRAGPRAWAHGSRGAWVVDTSGPQPDALLRRQGDHPALQDEARGRVGRQEYGRDQAAALRAGCRPALRGDRG